MSVLLVIYHGSTDSNPRRHRPLPGPHSLFAYAGGVQSKAVSTVTITGLNEFYLDPREVPMRRACDRGHHEHATRELSPAWLPRGPSRNSRALSKLHSLPPSTHKM